MADAQEKDKLREVKFERGLTSTQYVRPYTMKFMRRNMRMTWELAFLRDGCSAIIYDKTRKQLVCVKQFRPSVFVRRLMRLPENQGKEPTELDVAKYPLELGVTIELCGGLCDKPGLSPHEIIKEEIYEEVGYKVPLDRIELVQTTVDIDASGAQQSLFYVEVTKADVAPSGGGGCASEGEVIENVYFDVDKLDACTKLQNTPPMFNFALYWFIANKQQRLGAE